MATENLKSIEKRIARLKREIAGAGDLRPGTLSVQYRNPAEKKTPFNQLSYTRRSKSRSEYVRAGHLQILRREIDEYKRFRTLIEGLVDLSIQASKMRLALLKSREPPNRRGKRPNQARR